MVQNGPRASSHLCSCLPLPSAWSGMCHEAWGDGMRPKCTGHWATGRDRMGEQKEEEYKVATSTGCQY